MVDLNCVALTGLSCDFRESAPNIRVLTRKLLKHIKSSHPEYRAQHLNTQEKRDQLQKEIGNQIWQKLKKRRPDFLDK